MQKQPLHFKVRDVIHDFFAALIFGLTLIFKGNLVYMVEHMGQKHIIGVVVSTVIILTLIIYFAGYKGLADKTGGFFWFWLERFIGHYAIALIVATYLVVLFAYDLQAGSIIGAYEMIVVLTMPCAIGAAVPNILKDY